MVKREEVKKEVVAVLKTMLDDYFDELKEEVIEFAVDDVFETSAIEDEGFYNDSDVRLACRRAIVYFINGCE